MQKQYLGMWPGITDHIGNGLTYKVINEKVEVISRSTGAELRISDYNDPNI